MGVSMGCLPVEPSKPSNQAELSSIVKPPKEEGDKLKQHGLASNAIFGNVLRVAGSEGPMKKMASLIFQIVFSAAQRAKRTIARRQGKQSPITKKTSRTVRELFEERGDQ